MEKNLPRPTTAVRSGTDRGAWPSMPFRASALSANLGKTWPVISDGATMSSRNDSRLWIEIGAGVPKLTSQVHGPLGWEVCTRTTPLSGSSRGLREITWLLYSVAMGLGDN